MKAIISILLFSSFMAMAAPKHAPKPRSLIPSTNHVYRVTCPDCGTVQTNHPSAVLCRGGRTLPDGEVVRDYALMFNCACGGAFMAKHEFHTRQAVAELVAMDVVATNKPPKVIAAPKAKP